MHSLTKFSLKPYTNVLTDSRSEGAVAIMDKSFSLDKAKFKDLGIGVAVKLRTLISPFIFFNFSF